MEKQKASIQTLESILNDHPFFNGLDSKYLKFIIECAKNVRFNTGDYIFRESEEADTFYIIRHGQVSLEIESPGIGVITVQTLGEGDVLGWSWLFPPYIWPLDARAIKLVRAVALDGKCIRDKCEEDPKLGYELMKRLTSILSQQLHGMKLKTLDVYGARN